MNKQAAILCVAAVIGVALPAMAEMDFDPKPWMRWEDLTGCELIVAAKYEKHDATGLYLRVVRPLKGAAKANDVIHVLLQHRYSVQTELTGWWVNPDDKGRKDIPRVCYQTQVCNPGDLVPMPLSSDARNPSLYFFPKAQTPALERMGQVQSDLIADGWEQAANGKSMNLTFRLLQSANLQLAHEAVEELYRTRDAKVLRQLIDWLVSPPPDFPQDYPLEFNDIGSILTAIGDRKGDVYDPLLAWLKKLPAEKNRYGHYAVARVMASLDAARAYDDFMAILRGDGPHKNDAIGYLSDIPSEKAIDVLVGLLGDKATASQACGAFQSILSDSPRVRSAPWPKLRRYALGRIVKAYDPALVDANARGYMAPTLEYYVGPAKPVDLELAQKVLLDEQASIYKQMSEPQTESDKMIKAIIEEPDPKFIPLLVTILKKVHAVHDHECYRYEEALECYAELFPNATRAELARQAITAQEFAAGQYSHFLRCRLWAILGEPTTLEQLDDAVQAHGKRWLEKRTLAASAVDALQKEIWEALNGRYDWHIEYMPFIDAKIARDMLEESLSCRQRYPLIDRAMLLAYAIRQGTPGLSGELIEASAAWETQERKNPRPSGDPYCPLLQSGDAAAMKVYLQKLAANRKVEYWQFGNRLGMSRLFMDMFRDLLAQSPRDYFKLLPDLLESDQLEQREFAQEELREKFMAFGYDAQAVKDRRQEAMKVLRPILEKVSTMNALERYGYVSAKLGHELNGQPGKSWLGQLSKLVGDDDPDVSELALAAVGEILSPQVQYALRRTPPPRRQGIMQACLADWLKVEK